MLEATDGFEVTVTATLTATLTAAKLPLAVFNPRQIRAFARARMAGAAHGVSFTKISQSISMTKPLQQPSLSLKASHGNALQADRNHSVYPASAEP